MDGNPVALVDPWGASTDDGEKGGAQKHADNYKAETGRSYSTDPSDGYVFEGVDVSPPAAPSNTPANFAFANDATKFAQQFMFDMVNQQRMQTALDYEQRLSFLEKAGAFLRGLNDGGGDYTDWDVSGGWQI
jgi:hypothetical protein